MKDHLLSHRNARIFLEKAWIFHRIVDKFYLSIVSFLELYLSNKWATKTVNRIKSIYYFRINWSETEPTAIKKSTYLLLNAMRKIFHFFFISNNLDCGGINLSVDISFDKINWSLIRINAGRPAVCNQKSITDLSPSTKRSFNV